MSTTTAVKALPPLSDTALYPGRGPRNEAETDRYWGWKTVITAPLLDCPTCHSPAFEWCRTLDAGWETATHVGRYRAVHASTIARLTTVANALLASLPEVLAISRRRSTPDGLERMWDRHWSADPAKELAAHKLHIMSYFVVCHSCCAPAAEPCRTSKGRLPGRITSSHNSRWETVCGPRLSIRELRAQRRQGER